MTASSERAAELRLAMDRARRLYHSAGFRRAYVNGVSARLAGRSEATCPYRVDNAKTWLAAWRHAWLLGYGSVGDFDL